jgi:Domain of unknown function (DUF6046)
MIRPQNPTNIPSIVSLNNIDLPKDVVIGLNGEKVIAESKILDGAYIFERIGRKPFEINLEFNLRDIYGGNYVFPNDKAYEVITDIWQVDQVVPIINTFLNKLGITDVVIKTISFSTIRGNTDLPCSLHLMELFNSTSQNTSLYVNV